MERRTAPAAGGRVALLLILLLAAFLRLLAIDAGWFGVDQARDLAWAASIVSGEELPHVGPLMRGRVHLPGPLYARKVQRRAASTGFDFDHLHPQFGPLLQVMPWPVYQSMTTSDIKAIYTYLQSIPPALPCVVVGPNAPDPTCRTAP